MFFRVFDIKVSSARRVKTEKQKYRFLERDDSFEGKPNLAIGVFLQTLTNYFGKVTLVTTINTIEKAPHIKRSFF